MRTPELLSKDATLQTRYPRFFAESRQAKAHCRQCGYDRIAGKSTCAFCGASGYQRITAKPKRA